MVIISNSVELTAVIAKSDVKKIACVGDSITAGYGDGVGTANRYSTLLQNLLGSGYVILNFGQSGAYVNPNNRASSGGTLCYTELPIYQNSLNCSPDVVVLMLGTNDVSNTILGGNNTLNLKTFRQHYRALIQSYQNIGSTVYVATAPFLVEGHSQYDNLYITDVVSLQKITAEETGCRIIDINTVTQGHIDWYLDKLHLNAVGHAAIADAIVAAIHESKN